MKRTFLILALLLAGTFCRAETVGQYIIYVDSFSAPGFTNMIQYAVNNSKVLPQGASMVRWLSNVSADTSINEVVRKDWRDNTPAKDDETVEIYMECDARIEGFHPIENFIAQGKIAKIGFYTFSTKTGYNRNLASEGNIYDAAQRRQNWIDRWHVEISTS